ncbi:unnamed protein product [Aureobasidium uvarum]|uniref:Glucosamine 6-phosphate N-acetyltransferase n=1 Tax=Aureobasidium uvarum TaxID=2773716 RepID=A0A9N8KDZ1_9PEZI|nr:unnamed protein product [Aureobasidium uvarum]
MSSDSLFSPDLISSEVAAALPEGYTIRPLRKGDYHAGFLDVLAVLTTVGDVSEQDFNQRFEEMQASGALGRGAGGYHILVILNGDNKIVGTGALIVGHIEDIAVAKDQQGKKLGLRIIQALDHVAEKVGCYKANEGFYVKCGFKRAGLEMAHYYNKS